MRRTWIALLGLVALFLWGFLTVETAKKKIPQDLKKSAIAALGKAGLEGVEVEMDGRDAILAGEVPTNARKGMAGSTVDLVDGIRKVENRIVVAVDPGPETPTVPPPIESRLSARWSDGVLRVGGQVGGEAAAKVVRAAAAEHFGDARIVNTMKTSDGVTRDEFKSAVAAGLQALQSLNEGRLLLRGEKVDLSGVAPSADVRSATLAALKDAVKAPLSLSTNVTYEASAQVGDAGASDEDAAAGDVAVAMVGDDADDGPDEDDVLAGEPDVEAPEEDLTGGEPDVMEVPEEDTAIAMVEDVGEAPEEDIPAPEPDIPAVEPDIPVAAEEDIPAPEPDIPIAPPEPDIVAAPPEPDVSEPPPEPDIPEAPETPPTPSGDLGVPTAGPLTDAQCQTGLDALVEKDARLTFTKRNRVTPETEAQVAVAAGLLQRCPDAKIVIEGFTNPFGDPDTLRATSRRRALNIMNELKKNGIAKARMSYKGYGYNRPRYSNSTAEGRKWNERVEFRVKGVQTKRFRTGG